MAAPDVADGVRTAQAATIDQAGPDLVPPHETIGKHAAVGLDRTAGWLVRPVVPDSHADHAGVHAGGSELRFRHRLDGIPRENAPHPVQPTAVRGP